MTEWFLTRPEWFKPKDSCIWERKSFDSPSARFPPPRCPEHFWSIGPRYVRLASDDHVAKFRCFHGSCRCWRRPSWKIIHPAWRILRCPNFYLRGHRSRNDHLWITRNVVAESPTGPRNLCQRLCAESSVASKSEHCLGFHQLCQRIRLQPETCKCPFSSHHQCHDWIFGARLNDRPIIQQDSLIWQHAQWVSECHIWFVWFAWSLVERTWCLIDQHHKQSGEFEHGPWRERDPRQSWSHDICHLLWKNGRARLQHPEAALVLFAHWPGILDESGGNKEVVDVHFNDQLQHELLRRDVHNDLDAKQKWVW